MLAVLSDERLPGKFKDIPTAKEQGSDVVWNIWRGFYIAPNITDEQYNYWVDTITKLSNTEEFAKERELRGLFPFTKIGKDFDVFIKEEVKKYKQMAQEAGLTK